jgi:hypothetical protein
MYPNNRIAALLVTCALIVFTSQTGLAADDLHPLQVHMDPWFKGSRDWRTPNPDYDPASDGQPNANDIREFAVRWEWDETGKLARGVLLGIRADGTSRQFWSLFAFYNPVTEQVTYLQTGTNGALITGETPARTRPLLPGEKDILDTTDYWPDGTVNESRHVNTFNDDGTHTSLVFERDEDGAWQERATWVWTLTSAQGGSAKH